jgi:hypothetical protein
MLDLSYFQNQNSNVQGFFNGGTWQTWIKPRGAKLVNIICVGSGSGGGGGFQAATGSRSGGGGGGTGATSRLTIDANLLPNILYVLVGVGGQGGLGGSPPTSGSSGQNSFVCLIPDISSVSNVVLRSGTTPSVGGTAGRNTGANAPAGIAETINVVTNNIFVNLGTFTFQAGVNGSIGGTGSAQNLALSNFITGGMGGGGTGTGGGIVGTGVFPVISTTPVNTNGQDGIILYKPTLMLYGGTGGGGTATVGTNGGNGGNGAFGAGGGGGGSSTNTGVNAGNGGIGGDGFTIITTSF